MFKTLNVSGKTKSARGPLTLTCSIGLHVGLLSVLVLIPLIYTEALPLSAARSFFLRTPAPPPAPRRRVKIVSVQRWSSQFHNGMIYTPKEIPQAIAKIVDESAAPLEPGGSDWGVENGMPGGSSAGVPWGLPNLTSTPPPPPSLKAGSSLPPRVSVGGNIQAAKLVYGPKPTYPLLAKQMRIQGAVVMEAIISKDGTVQSVQLQRGHPLLVQAAMDAVRQWRYRPTLLNGQSVEVLTTITVNFMLTNN